GPPSILGMEATSSRPRRRAPRPPRRAAGLHCVRPILPERRTHRPLPGPARFTTVGPPSPPPLEWTLTAAGAFAPITVWRGVSPPRRSDLRPGVRFEGPLRAARGVAETDPGAGGPP